MEKLAVIEIENLTYYYPEEEKPALEGINLSIPEGEFVLVIGGSGSGKSSLLRAMNGLIPGFYGGTTGGTVRVKGAGKESSGAAGRIGMVFQDPESQLVMTNVEQELAFGLENLGLPVELMARRIMEVAGALTLHPYLQQSVASLSGGLKQKVALAAVLAMQPDVLLLDEPTSQLDPVAGEEILTMVRRLNEDNGLTVVLIEQRLERCFHLADRIIVLEQGKIVHDSRDRRETVRWAAAKGSAFIPPLARLFSGAGFSDIPLTVKEGRQLLASAITAREQTNGGADKHTSGDAVRNTSGSAAEPAIGMAKPLLEMDRVWFSYEGGPEVLKNVSLTVRPAEFLVIMGENAAGKTTLLKCIRGLLAPARGVVKVQGVPLNGGSVEALAGTIGYLAQNPNDYLFQPTVRGEVSFTLKNLGLAEGSKVEELLEKLELTRYAQANPRDLSVGERQRVALASILAAGPQMLLLDEPTRGLDYEMKAALGRLLLELQEEGTAILLVTHDVEFAAEFSTEIVFMSRGEIVARGKKEEMLRRSAFYSSQVSKLFSGYADSIVTLDEGIKTLRRIKDSGSKDNCEKQL